MRPAAAKRSTVALPGTLAMRALLIAPMTVSYPQSGWAEQSATDLWQSVRTVINQLAVHPEAVTLAFTVLV